MSRFATGVTIVTVASHGGLHGMTANAFMSVSLEPALVALSIGLRSRMNDRLHRGTRFGISILAAEHERLARHFGGRPDPDLPVPARWYDGVPLLEDAAASLLARVEVVHPAGDHRLFVAAVERVRLGDAEPLVFCDRRFMAPGLMSPSWALPPELAGVWG